MQVSSNRTGSRLSHNDSKAFASFDNHTLVVDFKRLGEATASMDQVRQELQYAVNQMRNATASAQGEAQCLKDAVVALEARLAVNEAALAVRDTVTPSGQHGAFQRGINAGLYVITAAAMGWFVFSLISG